MSLSSRLFIGITTWNSEQFLPLCLDSLRRTAPDAEVVVLDNKSVDETQNIAKDYGVKLIVKQCNQADALDSLATYSDKEYTLLIHADVVFISPQWIDVVLSKFSENTVLVSPEDIGCGPYTRPWGRNMPESSFMCFKTSFLDLIRVKRWTRKFRIPYYRNKIDFYGNHITYNLPSRIHDAQLKWVAMKVHVSNYLAEPYYTPDFPLKHWVEVFGHLNYGLGNFVVWMV